MADDTIHTAKHARAIASVLGAVAELDVLANSEGCWTRGEIELWDDDGYRLGRFVYEDECWRFKLDYAEATETDG